MSLNIWSGSKMKKVIGDFRFKQDLFQSKIELYNNEEILNYTGVNLYTSINLMELMEDHFLEKFFFAFLVPPKNYFFG